MTRLNKYGEIDEIACPVCKSPIKEGWGTCPECGKKLGQNTQKESGLEDCEELKEWCRNAIILMEESLMGVDREHQSNIPLKYVPFLKVNYEKWRKAAEAGIPEGQFLYGQMLIQNDQCEEGFKYLNAALNKYPPAKRALGDTLIDHGNREEGLRLLTEAADSGDAIACYILALQYECFVSAVEFEQLLTRDHVFKQKDKNVCGSDIVEFKEKYQRYMRRAAALGNNHAKSIIKRSDTVFWTNLDVWKVIK